MFENIVEKLLNLPAPLAAFCVGTFFAFIRAAYQKDETRWERMTIECIVCGCMSMTAGWGALAMGMDINWVLFFAGTIGSLGSINIRILMLKFLDKKAGE